MGAANVNDRCQNRYLVDEEEFSSGSPTGPSCQDGLHELNHSYQVLILSPERPLSVLVDGFIKGKVGGVEEAEKSAFFYTSRRHQVLEPNGMRASWQGKVSARETSTTFLLGIASLTLVGAYLEPAEASKRAFQSLPKRFTWGQPSAPPLLETQNLIFAMGSLSEEPHPHLKIVQKYTSADFCAQSKSQRQDKKLENIDNFKCFSAQILECQNITRSTT